MLTAFEEYFKLLENLHHSIQQAIADLPAEALDWVPGPEINSMGVLLAHVAGSERYWIGDVVGQEPSGRQRETEFETQGVDMAVLAARLEAVLAHSRTVLEKLTLADLAENRPSPRHEQDYVAAYALFHALEHTALHVGQIQLTRQLWDQHRAGSVNSPVHPSS